MRGDPLSQSPRRERVKPFQILREALIGQSEMDDAVDATSLSWRSAAK